MYSIYKLNWFRLPGSHRSETRSPAYSDSPGWYLEHSLPCRRLINRRHCTVLAFSVWYGIRWVNETGMIKATLRSAFKWYFSLGQTHWINSPPGPLVSGSPTGCIRPSCRHSWVDIRRCMPSESIHWTWWLLPCLQAHHCRNTSWSRNSIGWMIQS